MRSVESEGGSIDEAIQNALETLGMEREQVEIEILENAPRGLFGLGSRRARVRATVRRSLDATLQTADATDGRRSADVSRETIRAPRASLNTGSREGAASRAREVLEAILAHLVDSPRVEEVPAGGDTSTIHLALSGVDSGMIIGRRGQTLDALEHLASRIVFRDDVDPGMRLVVDVEGYRQRREESLRQLARRLAEKAKETGRVVTLNPMSPRDRRIVHLTLQSDSAVSTMSEGEGHYRRLLITPQGARRARESTR